MKHLGEISPSTHTNFSPFSLIIRLDSQYYGHARVCHAYAFAFRVRVTHANTSVKRRVSATRTWSQPNLRSEVSLTSLVRQATASRLAQRATREESDGAKHLSTRHARLRAALPPLLALDYAMGRTGVFTKKSARDGFGGPRSVDGLCAASFFPMATLRLAASALR
jgi:hypothetical protein